MASPAKKRATTRNQKAMLAFIRSLRGKYSHLPLMETLREMKREEKNY